MPLYKYKCDKCGNMEALFCSYADKTRQEKTLVCGKCSSSSFSPVFKVFVSCSGKAPPGEGCSSCTGGCSTCGS